MEKLPIEFHPEAVNEAAAAREWYAEIDPALGDAFTGELDHAIERITIAPHRWTPHLHGTQVFLLNRFPFLIVYRELRDRIQVVAIQHTRRRPGYWKSRI